MSFGVKQYHVIPILWCGLSYEYMVKKCKRGGNSKYLEKNGVFVVKRVEHLSQGWPLLQYVEQMYEITRKNRSKRKLISNDHNEHFCFNL